MFATTDSTQLKYCENIFDMSLSNVVHIKLTNENAITKCKTITRNSKYIVHGSKSGLLQYN